ncbi:RNA polymerase sigma factor [Amphiplicatus metriothermophilus]|uniref:RNA polymerase sigma-70 factor, ECF subfamily n=1 Tax=Amphiplicatus metriothermophilus TaxID=1519374 RepID=A0A239PPT6_9PROT|nr:sigma-70 family RNA polymerase sigma factor [Amphiplicatus metriothermophilus]MBB5518685.1 RNA polymerase sigma-70 factor (ECF subfamily) [Amphiplicatus metriothermophilus]SNT72158.1 RNA polymerase sigma-70 factor, ECF subfamily [Amphiplicatus metriothermophilus]
MTRDRSGAKQAEARLLAAFMANRGLIASVLRRYALSRLDIDDISQETIARALEAARAREIREPRRFLIGIAKNVARAEIERRSKMAVELVEDLGAERYVSDEPAVDEIVDGRRRMETFWKAVETLPSQCQKVFVLKYVYGASHKEIARKLGIAVSTVEKHVALGLKRCRERMLSELAGGPGTAEAESVLDLPARRR